MKVKELIELLQKEDPTREVCMAQDRRDYCGHTDAHKVEEIAVVHCRVDSLGYHAPTVCDSDDDDDGETYLDLLTIFSY